MIVVYNCGENYISTFATSMLSLFENNICADEISVYLVEDGISEQSRKKVQNIANAYNRNIFFVKMPHIEGLKLSPNFGRIFIGELLPREVDKAIYVDCDSVFADSLNELWNIDISKYYVGMVKDLLGPNDRKLLGLSPNGIYYSDALMLVNVKRWREEHIINKFLKYIRRMNGIIPYHEMGTINAVLDGNKKIMSLPARFNVQSQYFTFTCDEIISMRGLKSFYSQEEIDVAKKRPVMLHFTCDFLVALKPWMKGCNHPCVQKYLEYWKKTPWGEENLLEFKIPLAKRIYSAYYRIGPKVMTRWTTKILYSNIKPFIFRIKMRKQLRHDRKIV